MSSNWDIDTAIGVIESGTSATDDTSAVGEAWAVVMAELTRLRTENAILRDAALARAEQAERERDEALAALRLAVAECEAAHLLLTETYAFDWEFADDMPHDEAYRKARRARTAATTPESPDDSKEDA